MELKQEVLIRTSVTCSVSDCNQECWIDIPNEGLAERNIVSAESRKESEKLLLIKARTGGWILGGKHTLCPSHVEAAAAVYMEDSIQREERIRKEREARGEPVPPARSNLIN